MNIWSSNGNINPGQEIFRPKILTTLKNYGWKPFLGDLSSGVLVGIVALPLAIAFAIASGVSPERGLTTAIVAGFLISLLGGSRVQIGGPTGAFVVIVYAIVERHGLDGLIVSTLMAGLMLVGMGLLGLGAVIRFIPYPLTVGFTSGIAVVIFSSQVKDFLGLRTTALPGDFIGKWTIYASSFHTVDPVTVSLAVLSLLIILLWPRVNRRIPGSIVAIVVVAAAARFFQLPVETIASRFGSIPVGLPSPTWPPFDWATIKELTGPAMTIALLGAIESLLSATVADGMIEGRHRSNTELIAQGIANIASPLFGGIPATGAIARTATNVKNGGRTPVAGIVHSLTLLVIVLLFAPLTGVIPLCVLAAILVVVSYNMSEWRSFRALLKAPRSDVSVMVITFLLTVLMDLTVAVQVGMLLALVLFMKRMTDVTVFRDITRDLREVAMSEEEHRKRSDSIGLRKVPDGVAIFEAEGALFFGVAQTFLTMLETGTQASPKVIILRMRHVLALDASGIHALEDLKNLADRNRWHLVLSGIHAQPLFALDRCGLLERFGTENVLGSIGEALDRAGEILGMCDVATT